jgi:hypothetical protein
VAALIAVFADCFGNWSVGVNRGAHTMDRVAVLVRVVAGLAPQRCWPLMSRTPQERVTPDLTPRPEPSSSADSNAAQKDRIEIRARAERQRANARHGNAPLVRR